MEYINPKLIAQTKVAVDKMLDKITMECEFCEIAHKDMSELRERIKNYQQLRFQWLNDTDSNIESLIVIANDIYGAFGDGYVPREYICPKCLQIEVNSNFYDVKYLNEHSWYCMKCMIAFLDKTGYWIE